MFYAGCGQPKAQDLKASFFRTLLCDFAQGLLQLSQIAAGNQLVHFAGVVGDRAVAGAPARRFLRVKPHHGAA